MKNMYKLTCFIAASKFSVCKMRDTCTHLVSFKWHSESEPLCDWRFTANRFVLVTNPLRLMTLYFIFQITLGGYSPYVTSSLMRGWVCHLQLLLVLSSAVILRSDTVSDSRLLQPGGPAPHIYILQEQGGPLMPSGSNLHIPIDLIYTTRWYP
jgi:hypothetical protein